MQGKLQADFEALESNEAWRLFLKMLKEYAAGRELQLREASIDRVPRIQGELSAMIWALSRPKEIYESLTKGEPK